MIPVMSTAAAADEDKEYSEVAAEWWSSMESSFAALEQKAQEPGLTQDQLVKILADLDELKGSVQKLKYNTVRKVPEPVESPSIGQLNDLVRSIKVAERKVAALAHKNAVTAPHSLKTPNH
eukprot:TRINITY_DN29597_c0_g1_i2.p1 TRINITY_DN29597_c0_g1~~TRINITY_DN29597_c0_g1_i2.p1  ORF type:complete len:121 (+),score=28.54 TRINITY_DN29597_c0_g1_i2:2-364(+)